MTFLGSIAGRLSISQENIPDGGILSNSLEDLFSNKDKSITVFRSNYLEV